MKYLTEKEIAFIEALKNDYHINGDKSYLELLFLGEFGTFEKIKKELDNIFDGSYQKLFLNSDLLIKSVDGIYIGKYKDSFWGTGSEGEVFGLGKEIQNIAFYLITFYYGDTVDRKLDIDNHFKNHLKLNYDEYMKSYKDFCRKLELEYKESWANMEKESEEFEKELLSLD